MAQICPHSLLLLLLLSLSVVACLSLWLLHAHDTDCLCSRYSGDRSQTWYVNVIEACCAAGVSVPLRCSYGLACFVSRRASAAQSWRTICTLSSTKRLTQSRHLHSDVPVKITPRDGAFSQNRRVDTEISKRDTGGQHPCHPYVNKNPARATVQLQFSSLEQTLYPLVVCSL